MYLICYNDQIDDEEKMRRCEMLDEEVVVRVVTFCTVLDATPWPVTWHIDDSPKLTDEMVESIKENWARAVEAIRDVPRLHLEKLRDSHEDHWGARKKDCLSRLTMELEAYRRENVSLGRQTFTMLATMERRTKKKLANWDTGWNEAMECVSRSRDQGRFDLMNEGDRMIHRPTSPTLEEIRDWHRRTNEYEQETQRHVDHVNKGWSGMKERWQAGLSWYQKCSHWVTSAPHVLRKIKVRFSRELRSLGRQQKAESDKLSTFLVDSSPTLSVQTCPDLSEAIASALANHAVPASPADCPFLRGYGDVRKLRAPDRRRAVPRTGICLVYEEHKRYK
jgi:hypothetical protein